MKAGRILGACSAITLALTAATPANAYTLFHDLRVASDPYQGSGTCSVSGADRVGSPSRCSGQSGYAVDFVGAGAVPFDRTLSATSFAVVGTAAVGGHALAAASLLGGDGSLARFRAQSTGTPVDIDGLNTARTLSYAYLDIRFTETLLFSIPSTLQGAVAIEVQLPFDGTAYNDHERLGSALTGIYLNLVSLANGQRIAEDHFESYGTDPGLSVDDLLSTGATVIRQAGSSATEVPVRFNFAVRSGSTGTSPAFDFDFSHTVGLKFVLPAGVTVRSESGVLDSLINPPTQAVPEPATLASLALGLLGLAITKRSKRRPTRAGASLRVRPA